MLAADSDEEDGGGASWEGVRKGRGGEEEGEMHYLLPLKTRGKLVLQPPVPNPSGMVCVCVRACVCTPKCACNCDLMYLNLQQFLTAMMPVETQERR